MKYYNLTTLRWNHSIAYESSDMYRRIPTYRDPSNEGNIGGYASGNRFLKLNEAGEPEVVYTDVG